jgi:hypothetical protein
LQTCLGVTCLDALQLFLLRARDRSRSCALVDPGRMQRLSHRKSVCSGGGRAGILAQKPASGEPSEGFGRTVANAAVIPEPFRASFRGPQGVRGDENGNNLRLNFAYPCRLLARDNFRIVARLDRKRLGARFRGEEESRSEAFSISRLEGSRWRLRRAREMRLAMEFEWVFFRLLFGAKRECRHFQGCGQERQIPPHTWRIISRAASAAPAASF